MEIAGPKSISERKIHHLTDNKKNRLALQGRSVKWNKTQNPNLTGLTVLFLFTLVLGTTCAQTATAIEQGTLQQTFQGSFQARETENAHFKALVHLCNATEHNLNTTEVQYHRCIQRAENLTKQLETHQKRGDDVAALKKSLETQNQKIKSLENRLRSARWQKCP